MGVALQYKTSVRMSPPLISGRLVTSCASDGRKKLGQPVPDSNLVSEENSRNTRSGTSRGRAVEIFVVKGGSVPAPGLSTSRGQLLSSTSLFTTFSTSVTPLRVPSSLNSTILTIFTRDAPRRTANSGYPYPPRQAINLCDSIVPFVSPPRNRTLRAAVPTSLIRYIARRE